MRVNAWTSLCALVALACGAASAPAAILLSDNFDSYANTAAFTAAWPVVGALPSGTIVTDKFTSAPNSVNNVGTTVAAAAMRNKRSFAESGVPSPTQSITFSIDFYEYNAAASPARNHSNLQDGEAPGSYAQLIALGQNNNLLSAQDGGNYYMARILGHTPVFLPPTSGPANPAPSSGAFFKLNDPGAPLRSNGWHNLAVTISDTNFKFYVDGILSKTVANTGTLRSYDHVRLGSGLSNASVAVNWDNVSVSTTIIPEPATWALGGFAMVGCLLVARGRKAA